MWTKLLNLLAVLLGVFGINILSHKRGKAQGKTEAELEQAEDELGAANEANRIRDRLNSDSEYADSMRERFTRR